MNDGTSTGQHPSDRNSASLWDAARREQLRLAVTGARLRNTLIVLPPDEVEALLDLVDGAAVAFSDPRLKYVELQVDADAWERFAE